MNGSRWHRPLAREYPIAVYYDDIIVGSYRADLLIERRLTDAF